jgi:hypothetical protein
VPNIEDAAEEFLRTVEPAPLHTPRPAQAVLGVPLFMPRMPGVLPQKVVSLVCISLMVRDVEHWSVRLELSSPPVRCGTLVCALGAQLSSRQVLPVTLPVGC